MSVCWKSITYEEPKVMGILNVTPDSFYDGGTNNSDFAIAKRIETMVNEGVDIIDIGACSTRPNADIVDAQEEIRRLQTALRIVKHSFPNIPISIDTFRVSVIQFVLDYYGECMVNDISGGNLEEEMMPFVAKHHVPFVCMHMQGTPKTMQINPHYEDVVAEELHFFEHKLSYAQQLGIEQFIIDPGFGFGKTVQQNYDLLRNLAQFKQFNVPILIGLSRKSMIQKILNCTANDALNGTTVLNTIALLNGANILRVHDVKEAKEVVKLVKSENH